MSNENKVIVAALDGASWNVIEPMLKNGELPTIEKIMKEGAYGKLESEEPLISPRIWTSMFTGKHPNKHGIKDFYSTQESLKAKRLWEILREQGETVGLFDLISLWEADSGSGFYLPGRLSLTQTAYPKNLTFYNELRQDVTDSSLNMKKAVGYGLKALRNGVRIPTLLYLGKQYLNGKSKAELSRKYLLRQAESRLKKDIFFHYYSQFKPDFAIYYDNGIDSLSHIYWRYFQPKYFPQVCEKEVAKWGSVIPDYYQEIDSVLEKFKSQVDRSEDTVLFVVSDHGFKRKSGGQESWIPKISKILQLLNLEKEVYAMNTGCILLRKTESTQVALKEVGKLFEKISVKGSKEPLFDTTLTKEGYIKACPKCWIPIQDKEILIPGGEICVAKDIARFGPGGSGVHALNGVLLAYGPGIQPGRIKGATIYDVTPTILALMRYPIAQDMDGRVLIERLSDYSADEDITEIPTYEDQAFEVSEELQNSEKEELERRLRDLGYLD